MNLREAIFPPQTPGLLSFLPMLFVAWSDDVLTPGQAKIIREVIEKQDWLTEEERSRLLGWLDPGNPPSAAQVKAWLSLIRYNAGKLPPAERRSLAELGLQLARVGANGDPDSVISTQAALALTEVEKALELIGQEATRELLHDERRPETEAEPLPQPGFEVERLRRLLDQPNPELREKMRILLSDPFFDLKKASPVKEDYRETVLQWTRELARQGMGGWYFPEAYGGKNDMGGYVTIFEMLGYHDLSLLTKFGVQFGLFGGSVLHLGTARHHQRYLEKIASLELPGCFAMTEKGHGSNVRDLETTATYNPQTREFLIHTPKASAHKEYIGNAAVHGKMASVFAQLITQGESYGVHAFLVPIRDDMGRPMPGVRIEDSGQKLGLNGVDNGRLWFDQVCIPRENLLNRYGDVQEDGTYTSPIPSESRRFFTMLGNLVGGRVCVPIAGLSAAKKALTIALRYGEQRRQFGPAGQPEVKLLDYRTHQRRLLPLLAKSFALHFAHRDVVSQFLAHGEGDTRELEARAAGLKAISTWHTTRTIQECREACGGAGYLAENHFAALKADTDVFTTFEGDNTVLMQLVAKGRLYDFKREFRDMNFLRLTQYAGHQALTYLTELNPVVTRRVEESHLRDREFHLAAFRYREEKLVQSAARRLKKRLDAGEDSFEAFNEVQDHLVTMSHACVERMILEQFAQAIAQVEDPGLSAMLNRLCDLYALSELERDRGWFLESGYFEGVKAKAIREQVNRLCSEVRPDAWGLTEAFGIPEACL